MNRLVNNDGLLKVKKYCDIYIVFPFICVFLDKAIACSENGELTKMNNFYTELAFEEYRIVWSGQGNLNEWMVALMEFLKELKEISIFLIADKCETGICTRKFHFQKPILRQ